MCATDVTSVEKCRLWSDAVSETQQLVWVFTFCKCPKFPFRTTLAIYSCYNHTYIQNVVFLSNAESLTALASCTVCDPGHHCPSQNMTAVGSQCTAGYYCISNSIDAAPVNQTYSNICPIGTVIDLTLSPLAVNFEDFDDLCKQFGSRWSTTKCGASSEIQIVWHSD